MYQVDIYEIRDHGQWAFGESQGLLIGWYRDMGGQWVVRCNESPSRKDAQLRRITMQGYQHSGRYDCTDAGPVDVPELMSAFDTHWLYCSGQVDQQTLMDTCERLAIDYGVSDGSVTVDASTFTFTPLQPLFCTGQIHTSPSLNLASVLLLAKQLGLQVTDGTSTVDFTGSLALRELFEGMVHSGRVHQELVTALEDCNVLPRAIRWDTDFAPSQDTLFF